MLSIYNASAGSGKTFTLTREYLRMLLRDRPSADDQRLSHSRILAVTFTKKATAEMKERILYELFILSTNPDKSAHWATLEKDLSISRADILQRARRMLVDILQDYSRFSVSTIDGFFQQVIRTFARELGLSATYDLSLDGEEMIQEAVDDIFKRIREDQAEDKELIKWLMDFIDKNISDDHKWNPNEEIKLFSRQLLKERLMRNMSSLQEIFDNKDFMRQYRSELKTLCVGKEQEVTELLNKAKQIFEREDQDKWARNIVPAFNKSAEEWLRGDMGATFFKIYNDPTKVYAKGKTTKQEQAALLAIYDEHLAPIFQSLYDICTGSDAKDYVTAKEMLPHLYTIGILQDVARQIQTTNRNIGRLPISETNLLVNQIIDGQEAPFIYERFGQYFRHYMIDEFQDTSAVQWENFAPLIHESESNNQANLIVGDVKQSIYRFRNSDWSLLKDVHRQFDGAQQHVLENNWRTAPIIVTENEKLIRSFSQQVASNIEEKYAQTQLGDDIRYMYADEMMHQEPATDHPGYFHLQYFEGNDADEQTLEAIDTELQSLRKAGIDLSRVTMLVRYTKKATLLANFLISRGYQVQSAEGLQIGTHPAIQLVINLLKQEDNNIESIDRAYIHQHYGTLSEEQENKIKAAQELPLYEQSEALINILHLAQAEEVTPYLTTFLDIVYQFTKNRVATRKSFLEYWERKAKTKTIPVAPMPNAIRIMTIHSSKGLEFDIVFIPFFIWELTKTRATDIIWCAPKTAPFNQLPLVAVHSSKNLLQSHFKQEYIQEQIAQSIDNLNLTYVAFTRPKYRLYIYSQINRKTIGSVGSIVHGLYKSLLNDDLIYRVPSDGEPAPLPPLEEDNTHSYRAQYVSVAIGDRLTLRSRSEDDFAVETPLATVDLGILMHLWLSYIKTWSDAEPALQRLLREGQVTEQQAQEMRQQLVQLQALILRERHEDWFSTQYNILAEQDIITCSGKIHRPDRVMIQDQHAIVVDYKFGYEQPHSHMEQVRDYMSLLKQMGYTTEGYIIYIAHQQIYHIQ